MTDEEDVRRIASGLPEVTQDDDGFAFKVRGKALCWSYMERVDPKRPRVRRPDVLAVRVAGEGEKQTLLQANPEIYFTTDHYNGYPAVLVRLSMIDIGELTELLTDAWRVQAPKRLVVAYEASR